MCNTPLVKMLKLIFKTHKNIDNYIVHYFAIKLHHHFVNFIIHKALINICQDNRSWTNKFSLVYLWRTSSEIAIFQLSNIFDVFYFYIFKHTVDYSAWKWDYLKLLLKEMLKIQEFVISSPDIMALAYETTRKIHNIMLC